MEYIPAHLGVFTRNSEDPMRDTDRRRSAARPAAGWRGSCAGRPGRRLRREDLSAGVPVSSQQGRRRRSRRRTCCSRCIARSARSGRRGAVVLDLSHHVQHGDVAAADGEVSAVAGTTRPDARRRDDGDELRRRHGGSRRLVGHGRRAGVPSQLRKPRVQRHSGACRRSIARRWCCGTFRGCRPRKPAPCCA